MLEFIPSKQVATRFSEGWQIVSRKRGDYAALMQAPNGWEPLLLNDKAPFRTCTVRGCDSKHKAQGFCRWHYEHFRTHGNPLTVLRAQRRLSGCSEDGCENKHEANGLCHKHIMRKRRAEKAAFECREAA